MRAWWGCIESGLSIAFLVGFLPYLLSFFSYKRDTLGGIGCGRTNAEVVGLRHSLQRDSQSFCVCCPREIPRLKVLYIGKIRLPKVRCMRRPNFLTKSTAYSPTHLRILYAAEKVLLCSSARESASVIIKRERK